MRSHKQSAKTSKLARNRFPKNVQSASKMMQSSIPADGQLEPHTKIGTFVALLRRPGGTTIGEMAKATGWQSHSVRGALAGTIKKKLGLKVQSKKSGDVRIYRIAS